MFVFGVQSYTFFCIYQNFFVILHAILRKLRKKMRLALIGYGKMGHMIEGIALSRGHEIVCRIDKDNLSDFDSEAFASAEVAIEFTTPQTAEANILHAWAHNVPVVSGTTGWDVEAFLESHPYKRDMLVWKSNFSIGVNVLFELNKQLKQLLAPYTQYSPSITEVHHVHKLDKPSGTAKTLAEAIGGEVPVESIREGEVPGIHTVTWDSDEDTIIIQHIAKGRQGFALGAVMAAEQLGKQ